MDIKCIASAFDLYRYWANGCQILSPHDTGIQNAILSNLLPHSWDTDLLENHPAAVDVTEQLFAQYVKDVAQLGFGGYPLNTSH